MYKLQHPLEGCSGHGPGNLGANLQPRKGNLKTLWNGKQGCNSGFLLKFVQKQSPISKAASEPNL